MREFIAVGIRDIGLVHRRAYIQVTPRFNIRVDANEGKLVSDTKTKESKKGEDIKE